MDFLDPKKHRAHMIRLAIGYVLIAIGILIGTVILLYQAYGFGVGKDGQVIQNGLVFVSSQPNPANIYLDGKLYESKTNTRMQLPAATYIMKLQRDGYREWQRSVTVEGGKVVHYDYPLLVPNKLATANIREYAAAPPMSTQSPDRRWVVVQQPGSISDFQVYDIADPKKVSQEIRAITIPVSLLTAPRATDNWKMVEWSTDNRHVLLEHAYTGGKEYIMLDHRDVGQSVNVTRTLKLTAAQQITLRNKKFDQYFVYDTAAHSLGTTTLNEEVVITPMLEHVLSFKTYGTDIVLYFSDLNAKPGKVMLNMKDGNNTYILREYSAQPPYLVELSRYSGDWYAVAGASGENKTYVYKNPQTVRRASPTKALVPVQILKVPNANYVAFSANARFVMAENGDKFANYDAEYDKGYTFTAKVPIDAPQERGRWMDGHRLSYVSGGKVVIWDYDTINYQTLSAANPAHTPFFDRDYEYLYTIGPSVSDPAKIALTVTSLLTPEDQ